MGRENNLCICLSYQISRGLKKRFVSERNLWIGCLFKREMRELRAWRLKPLYHQSSTQI